MHQDKFDKRVIARNMVKQIVTNAEYDAFIKQLPDLSDECEASSVSLYGRDQALSPGDGEASSDEDSVS